MNRDMLLFLAATEIGQAATTTRSGIVVLVHVYFHGFTFYGYKIERRISNNRCPVRNNYGCL